MHRKAANCAEVFRNVLTGNAVAACCAADKISVFILERHRQTVYFGLYAEFPVLAERLIHAFAEGGELIEREHITQAFKRHLMMNGRKL